MANDTPTSDSMLTVSNVRDRFGELWPVRETIRSTRVARDADDRTPKVGNVSRLANGRLASFTRQAA